ncbi:hypothetical protein IPN35_03970 [Candidatus Peregrinibacteria bacterium]|nr:MAG: hypothetical protein IPN35_03970 [Candidatus Peregrinibacteria bacterium]
MALSAGVPCRRLQQEEYQSLKGSAVGAINNMAYEDQQSGVINNYNVHINISEKREKKKKEENSDD